MAVDKEQLRSGLIRIRNEPGLAPFKTYLGDLVARETVQLKGQDGYNIYRAQGAVRIAEEILKTIEDSTKVRETKDPSVKTAGDF